jgi:hypothetical protein
VGVPVLGDAAAQSNQAAAWPLCARTGRQRLTAARRGAGRGVPHRVSVAAGVPQFSTARNRRSALLIIHTDPWRETIWA